MCYSARRRRILHSKAQQRVLALRKQQALEAKDSFSESYDFDEEEEDIEEEAEEENIFMTLKVIAPLSATINHPPHLPCC